MTNAAARALNLARVFEHLLGTGASATEADAAAATRSGLIRATGLSKATIGRLVSELEAVGLVDLRDAGVPERRGRRPDVVEIRRGLGCTIGVSLGLRSSHAVAVDLAGRELGRHLAATPAFAGTSEIVTWVAEVCEALGLDPAESGAPLRLSVAIPGRVRDGVPISELPAPLEALRGSRFGDDLAERLGLPVEIASDADMALAGVTALARLDAAASAVLFTMSTVLTVAARTRSGLIEARSSALGDFAALPLRSSPELLSVRGLRAAAAESALPTDRLEELWEGSHPGTVRVRERFTDSLVHALTVAAIALDPEICVLTGRLSPLAAAVRPEVERRLEAVLELPPALLITGTDDNGLTTATGAAWTALSRERQRVLAAIRDGRIAAS